MIIDSHCHLEYEPMHSNLDVVIKRATDNNVKYLLSISTTDESYKKIKEIVNKYENVYGTYGIHPHEVKSYKNLNCDSIIDKVIQNKKIIGIGETGLDFFYNHSDKDTQISSFKAHIEASIDLNKPIIIHSRDAEKETFEILNSYKNLNLKILMHCFTGSLEFSKKLLTLNAFFSASGIITFKNSTELQNTFKTIPFEKLLIETDSPFLAPTPMRGKKNEPSFIKYTLEKLSRIKETTEEKMSKITTNNFNKLFNL